jgi:hypothetical protein
MTRISNMAFTNELKSILLKLHIIWFGWMYSCVVVVLVIRAGSFTL